MKLFKLLLWVPIIFSMAMGGLAIAKLWADGIGVEFFGAPAVIITAYEQMRDALAHYVYELWFQIELTDFGKDAAVVWFMFTGSLVRVIFSEHSKAFGIENWSSRAFYSGFAIGLGPVAFLFMHVQYFGANFWNSPEQDNPIGALWLTIITNPICAAALLWWNAAEIARLTAGVG